MPIIVQVQSCSVSFTVMAIRPQSLITDIVIEGDGRAILYTGDIRSEPWFVNSLTRNPFLIEYTCGLKKLDCLYLDTSNTNPIPFPTKADGVQELLQKVSKYPADAVFHFEAWTFGYEEIWMALSRALKSQVSPPSLSPMVIFKLTKSRSMLMNTKCVCTNRCVEAKVLAISSLVRSWLTKARRSLAIYVAIRLKLAV